MNEIFCAIKNEPIVKALLELARERHRNIYLVGGFVRDALLNRRKEKLDLDFAVDCEGVSLAREFADRTGASFVLLDEVHGVARAVYSAGDRYYEFDFADFRSEFLEGDLRLRDFTVNAIAVDLYTLELIDPAGGQKDLEKKSVRAASDSAFIDDPARIVRAFSLAAELGFEVERHTEELIKDSVSRIACVSAERIRDELFGILEAKNSAQFIERLDEFGILDLVLPEIKPMRKTTQGPYHHLDVWMHSILTLKGLDALMDKLLAPDSAFAGELAVYLKEKMAGDRTRLSVLKFATLLHDIGKPIARTVDEEGKIKFIGHEKAGADMLEEVCRRLKLSARETDSIKRLTLHHLRPGYLAESDTITKRAVLRVFRDAGDDSAGVLLLSLADKLATRGPLTTQEMITRHEDFVLDTVEGYFKRAQEVAKPPKLLSGDELMKELSVGPGPLVGEILRQIEEAQVEGQIKSKDEAIKLAKDLLKGF